MKLLDVAADGRVLLGQEVSHRRVDAMVAGATAPVDVSLRASSTSQWISAGGSMFTLSDQATAKYSSYLQKAGGPAMPLGDGQAYGGVNRWPLGDRMNAHSSSPRVCDGPA
jgi:hypothetical protein